MDMLLKKGAHRSIHVCHSVHLNELWKGTSITMRVVPVTVSMLMLVLVLFLFLLPLASYFLF